MIKDINQITVRGRIGSVKFFGQNNGIASISVATTDGYKDKSGTWQETTTWHRVKAFATKPGMIDFSALEKGKIVHVNGKVVNNKFTDRDGNERETVEIEAADIVVIEENKPQPTSYRSTKQMRDADDFAF